MVSLVFEIDEIKFLKVLMKRIRGAGWTLAEGSEDGAIITEEDLRFGKYRKCAK